MKKQKGEFNLKAFLQSEERQVLVNNLQSEINHNSEMYNIKGAHGSNILVFPKKVKRSKEETKELKQAKSKYKQLYLN